MTRIDRRALFTSGAAAALLAATGVSAQPQPSADRLGPHGAHSHSSSSSSSRAWYWLLTAVFGDAFSTQLANMPP